MHWEPGTRVRLRDQKIKQNNNTNKKRKVYTQNQKNGNVLYKFFARFFFRCSLRFDEYYLIPKRNKTNLEDRSFTISS